MRQLVFHRWAVVFLLVTRLVMGEFAHGMPHQAVTDVLADGTSHESSHCLDHTSSGAGSPPELTQATTVLDDGAVAQHGKDCCETGSCKCPCIHVPAVTVPMPVTNLVWLHGDRASVGTTDLARQAPSTPFRPPA